jgi:RimJ/RimL family protein N-acetyltransferase
VILVGLENPDYNLEFKRIVIADKRRGFGREAVCLIKEYAFEYLKMHRLWLEVMVENTGAFAMYQTEGFINEGLHREAVKHGDSYSSLRVMSMLADEYQPDEAARPGRCRGK